MQSTNALSMAERPERSVISGEPTPRQRRDNRIRGPPALLIAASGPVLGDEASGRRRVRSATPRDLQPTNHSGEPPCHCTHAGGRKRACAQRRGSRVLLVRCERLTRGVPRRPPIAVAVLAARAATSAACLKRYPTRIASRSAKHPADPSLATVQTASGSS